MGEKLRILILSSRATRDATAAIEKPRWRESKFETRLAGHDIELLPPASSERLDVALRADFFSETKNAVLTHKPDVLIFRARGDEQGHLILPTISGTISALYATSPREAHRIFELLSGIASTIIMACWIGRFDSKFIDANPLMLPVLYLYAAIQVFWFFIESSSATLMQVITPEVMKEVLYAVAFGLKVVLFLFVCWLLQTGRLLFYFGNVRLIIEDVLREWAEAQGRDERRPSHGSPSLANIYSVSVFFAICIALATIVGMRAGIGSDRLIGWWHAEINWEHEFAEKILLAKGRKAENPISRGCVLITNSSSKSSEVPEGLSYWIFQNKKPETVDLDRALIVVFPSDIALSGKEWRIDLRTARRMFFYKECEGEIASCESSKVREYYVKLTERTDGLFKGRMYLKVDPRKPQDDTDAGGVDFTRVTDQSCGPPEIEKTGGS